MNLILDFSEDAIDWQEALQTTAEEDAISRAQSLMAEGKRVTIWDGDRRYWQDGQYVSHPDSAMEREWRGMGGGESPRYETSLPCLLQDIAIINGSANGRSL